MNLVPKEQLHSCLVVSLYTVGCHLIMRIHSSLLCSIALLCNCVYFSQLIASIIQALLILGFDLVFFCLTWVLKSVSFNVSTFK